MATNVMDLPAHFGRREVTVINVPENEILDIDIRNYKEFMLPLKGGNNVGKRSYLASFQIKDHPSNPQKVKFSLSIDPSVAIYLGLKEKDKMMIYHDSTNPMDIIIFASPSGYTLQKLNKTCRAYSVTFTAFRNGLATVSKPTPVKPQFCKNKIVRLLLDPQGTE